MTRKPKKPATELAVVEGEVTYDYRLSQEELLAAVNLYLRARGDIPKTTVGRFRYRFGIIGNPQMMIVGDPPPDAGQMYLEWDFTPLENVEVHPTFHRKP